MCGAAGPSSAEVNHRRTASTSEAAEFRDFRREFRDIQGTPRRGATARDQHSSDGRHHAGGSDDPSQGAPCVERLA